jgi:hypothetical protein
MTILSSDLKEWSRSYDDAVDDFNTKQITSLEILPRFTRPEDYLILYSDPYDSYVTIARYDPTTGTMNRPITM